MRKLIAAAVISFALAMLTVEGSSYSERRQTPIIYELETLPVYGRKRPLKKHYVNRFISR